MDRPLTTHQAAKLAGVSPSAVLSWIERGFIQVTRTPGGHRRIERHEFLSFLTAHGMPPRREAVVERLLVIDDEPVFGRTMQRSFGELAPGLTVETATTPFDGLLRVSTFQPQAVLLDTYMDGLDGLEICRRLKEAPATRHIAVIATSGRPSRDLEVRYRHAGAVAFLEKPLNLERIIRLLDL
jgi:excisionase family DNA binding protein